MGRQGGRIPLVPSVPILAGLAMWLGQPLELGISAADTGMLVVFMAWVPVVLVP